MRLALVLLVLIARAAHADPHDEARTEFAAGQTADKQKNWQAAIEHYLRAYELAPHPFALFNIAADYEQLGQLREAARFYQRYLDESKDGPDRGKVEKQIADLTGWPAKLAVTSEPAGARVVIDGKQTGVTPFTGAISGGPHRIAAETESDRQTKDVSVEFAEPVEVSFTLQGASGTLVVRGTPAGAQVEIDGSRVGELPYAGTIASGTHKLRTTFDGYEAKEQTVLVRPSQPTTLDVALEKTPDPERTIRAQYFVGSVGGPALSGGDAYYAFELGVRGPKAALLVQFGEVDGATLVGLLYRYAFTDARIAPYIGGGYAFVKSGTSDSGVEAEAGVRVDLVRGTLTVALRAGVAVFYYAHDSATQTTVPLSLGFEASYGGS